MINRVCKYSINRIFIISFFLILAIPAYGMGNLNYPEGNILLQLTPTPDDNITPTPIPGNETRVIDELNRFSMNLPIGWHSEIPSKDANFGSTVITSYTESEISSFSEYSIPKEEIKMQIGVGDLNSKVSFNQWVSDRIRSETTDEYSMPGTKATAPYSYTLGNYSGMVFVVSERVNILEIDFPLNERSVVSIGITPAESLLLTDTLSALSTLTFWNKGEPVPTQLSSNLPNRSSESLHLPAALLQEMSNLTINRTETSLCREGSYNGDEAYESTITLQLPFMAGETWRVGGPGYFYGEGGHCNSANDYYATDWNYADGDDYGKPVMPVANGTVFSTVYPPCPISSYGCQVVIEHADGFRTRYGHFSSVWAVVGDIVNTSNMIGQVGSTGNSSGPHLHLSFLQNNTSYCYNNGQRCPNDESPSYPQGYKPSPMQTSAGPVNLQDGSIYTSINGRVLLNDLRNKDGWRTSFYVQNNGYLSHSVNIYFRDQYGNPTPADFNTCVLSPHQWCWIPVSEYNRIPSGTVGGAYLDNGENINVITLHKRYNGGNLIDVNSDNGFFTFDSGGDGAFELTGTTLYAPAIYSNVWNWSSSLRIMNTSAQEARITLEFIGRHDAGFYDDYFYPDDFYININGQQEFDVGNWVPSPWSGSLIITSDTQVALKITNRFTGNNKTFTYNGLGIDSQNSPSIELYVPDGYKNNVNLTTGITVQNLGDSSTYVWMRFFNRDGVEYPSYYLGTLEPYHVSGIFFSGISTLPNGWAGSVIVYSDSQPIAAIVRGDNSYSGGYFAHSAGSVPIDTIIFPYAAKNVDQFSSALLLQNTSANYIDAYLNFYNANGTPAMQQVVTLDPNGSYGLWLGNVTLLPAGWQGSLVITTYDQAYPYLVGILRNDPNYGGSAYNGSIR